MPAIFSVNAACLVFSTCNAAPLLPRAEQEVIEAFLQDTGTALGASEVALFEIASETNLDLNGASGRAQQAMRLVGLDRGPGFGQALEDALKKSPIAARIAAVTNTSRRVHLLPEGEFKGLFLDNDATVDNWVSFYDRFPNCGRTVLTSRVGFDRKGTLAVLFYSLRDPSQPGTTQLEVFWRTGERWRISEFARLARPQGTTLVTLTCKLRYFVAHASGEWNSEPLKLQVAKNQGTNLVCSVPESFKLAKSTPGLESVGWVLQIEEPAEVAGQLLTAVQDDFLPVDIFRFGRLYEVVVPTNLIGDLSFRLQF